MIRTLLASVGLAAITLTAAAGLQANGYFDDGDGPPPRVAVSYAGLDLTTPRGVRILEQRINAAIDDVCPRDWTAGLRGYSGTRDCRDHAIRGVEPQVRDAIGRAWTTPYPEPGYDRRRQPAADDDGEFPPGYDQRPAPPPPLPSQFYAPPPPPPPVTKVVEKPLPGGRLVRRTVTTTTVVTTTRRGSPEPVVTPPIVKPAKRPPARARYGRRPEVPGSWLPPVAWRAIERATLRAFATGRLTRWHVRDRDGIDRDGYVTVSPTRWIDGRACRNVRAIKQNGRRQIVVAEGTRCRRPGGGLDC